MAHEMTENDSAAYAIKPAWHGLGTVVDDYMTPREALEKSGLDWLVVQSDCAYFKWDNLLYNYETQSLENHPTTTFASEVVANIRNDTSRILGVVGESYDVVQNKELADIAYAIAGDATQVETMGSLRDGRQVYMLIKMDKFYAGHNDEVQPYFLLSNGHDGKLSLSGKPTSIRVVCANTLDMAIQGQSSFRFTHRGDKTEHIIEAKAMMKEMQKTGKTFQKQVSSLSQKQMGVKDIQKFWLEVYSLVSDKPVIINPQTDEEKKARLHSITVISKWAELFDAEREENKYGANAWIAMNAVTNWMDHERLFRGKNRDDNRVHSALFGRGARIKQGIFKKTLELI